MSERTVVHLLRHGEVANPDRILYGRLPGYHLSDAGVLMAKHAAQAVAGRDIVTLVSSPLDRAVETATPVAEQFGLDIRIDDTSTHRQDHRHDNGVGFAEVRIGSPATAPTISEIVRLPTDLLADAVAQARPGDRLLVMSNGDFGGVHQKLLDALAV